MSGAVLATIAINEARRAECKAVLGTFDAKDASISQRREYASCVYTVDGSGQPMDPSMVLTIKVAIALALLGGLLGAYYRVNPDGIDGYGVGPLQGFAWGVLGAAVAMFVVGLLGLAILFLFTA